MTENDKRPEKISLLSEDIETFSLEEIQQRINNITARQIQLEMQIKELQRAKIEFPDAREYAENIVETVREPLLVLTSELQILTANQNFYATFKVTPEDTIGNFIYDLGNRQWDIPRLRILLEEILPKATVFNDYEVEHEFLNIGRKIILLNAREIYQKKSGSHIILLAMEDITERRRAENNNIKLEAQNRQLQKAESLGVMAGAIAHHFNNKLGAVIGNLEMAIEDLPQGVEPPPKNLTAAMQAALKAAEVSGLMLTYLGHSAAKHELLDLSEICRRNLPLLQAAAINGIVIKANLPFPGPIINADANQIQQVLTNLITNAWEAISADQGAIDLTVKIVSSIDISEINRFPINWQSQGSNYACLEVTDAGCGIASEDIDKLFDPFFSSKFTGRGLGLSVVLGIVKAHEGAITVESKMGRRSIFRVFLPMSMEEIPRKPDKTIQHLAKERGGTVLLVDDEDMLREMIKNMLMRLGFTVITASDGIEAVEVYRQRQDEICCVICDLTMPLMGGYETVKALKVITPRVKVILSSGYNKEQATERFAGLEPAGFIQKPYSQKELAVEIWKVLDGK